MEIKKGDIVSICSLTTPEMLYSFLALSRIGAISNMLDPRIGSDGIKNHINENDSKVLITLDVFGAKLNDFVNDTSLEKIISFSLGDSLPKIKEFILSMKLKNQIKPIDFKGTIYTNDDLIKNKKYSNIKEIADGNDDACIVYTGGTTGEPKAVVLSNKSFVAMAIQYSHLKLNMKRKDTFLSIIPPFFRFFVKMYVFLFHI